MANFCKGVIIHISNCLSFCRSSVGPSPASARTFSIHSEKQLISNKKVSPAHDSRRSRKKPQAGDGKENFTTTSGVPRRSRGGGSSSSSGKLGLQKSASAEGGGGRLSNSRSSDISVCDTISESDFDRLVKLPPGLDVHEWVATHAFSYFHSVNLLCGAVSYQYCTADSCPVMSGPGNTQYTWIDDRGKKSKCGAPQYIDYVMSHMEKALLSEENFPIKYGNSYSPNFDSLTKKLFRFLWHVLAHLHHAHFAQLRWLCLDSQSAAVIAHFAAFTKEFLLLDPKDQLQLSEIAKAVRQQVTDTSQMIVVEESVSEKVVDMCCDDDEELIDTNEVDPQQQRPVGQPMEQIN